MRGVSLNPLVCEDLCEALDIWMGKIKTLQGQGPLSLVKNHTTLLWNAFYEERKKMWDLRRSTLLGIGDGSSKGEVIIYLDAFFMLTKLYTCK